MRFEMVKTVQNVQMRKRSPRALTAYSNPEWGGGGGHQPHSTLKSWQVCIREKKSFYHLIDFNHPYSDPFGHEGSK